METETKNMLTPWGISDDIKIIADGIRLISTPSHGGIWVSKARLAEMPEKYKTPSSFYKMGGQFFEEDCEWARVALSFPQFFPGEQTGAKLCLSHTHPEML